jgi:hypothetical protein
MSTTPLHRNRPNRTSLYLAVVSGSAAVSIAVWGLNILGGH